MQQSISTNLAALTPVVSHLLVRKVAGYWCERVAYYWDHHTDTHTRAPSRFMCASLPAGHDFVAWS